MIGVSSAGRSFRAIATYLAAGRTGMARDRVAWSAGRNLPTDDPELAGVCMRATAARNGRVERPVYHLALSFDPTDGVDRATMEAVADRVLARLGLAEHQAVLVAHNDRAHAHVHVLVNRVHPETGRVAARAFDYRAVQEVLRAEERRLGLREVPGTLVPGPAREPGLAGPTGPREAADVPHADAGHVVGRDLVDTRAVGVGVPATRTPDLGAPQHAVTPPRDARLDRGTAPPGHDRHAAQHTDWRTFVGEVRAQLPALREAPSWDAFEGALARHGWRLERRRTGLVVTNGTRYVRASRIADDCSMPALERRFGVAFDGRSGTYLERVSHDPSSAHPRDAATVSELPAEHARGRRRDARESAQDGAHVGPGASTSTRYVAARLREYDRALRLEHLAGTARALVGRAEARARAGDAAARDLAAADAAFTRSLRSVYRDPDAARRAFEAHRSARGADDAVRALADDPERYGALVTVPRASRFAFGRREDDTPAREAARVAARRAATLETTRDGPAAPEHTVAAERGLAAALDRAERLRGLSRAAPERADLAARLARGMSRLSDAERGQLARLVTPRQAALGSVLADTLDERRRHAREQPHAVTRGSSGARTRHAEATRVGGLLHRAVAHIAPREYRELRELVAAVRHPGLAAGQALRRALREAVLARDGAER